MNLSFLHIFNAKEILKTLESVLLLVFLAYVRQAWINMVTSSLI